YNLREDLEYGAAVNGIARVSAAEIDHPTARRILAFAQEVDVRDDAIVAVVGTQRANVGDQPAVGDLHLNLAADLAGHGDGRILVFRQGVELGDVHGDA